SLRNCREVYPTYAPAPQHLPFFCAIWVTQPANLARTISAITLRRCRPRMVSRSTGGYLYHLDAMQGVSFPDINSTPTTQNVAPPCKNTPIPGVPDVPGAVDPKTTTCLTPPRPVLWCHSSDGTKKNQTCKDEGPLTLDRSRTVDEEISAKVVDFLDRNDPKKTNKPFFVWYNPARMHVTTMLSPKYEAMLGTK